MVRDDLVERGATHVIGLLWDGGHPGSLLDLAGRGELPSVARLLERGCALAGGAVAEFPSLTLVNHTSMLTGVGPGRHGVVGNVYWDRELDRRVVPNDAATWHTTGELYRDGVTTLFEAVAAARPGVRTASVNEMTERGSWASTFALVRAALEQGGSVDPGEAGSAQSRDFLTAVRALLPDPLASDLVTHARCGEDDDYAFYSAIDLLGLSTMVGLFSAADVADVPALAWWSQYTTDAGSPRGRTAVGHRHRRPARLRRAPRRAARPPRVAGAARRHRRAAHRRPRLRGRGSRRTRDVVAGARGRARSVGRALPRRGPGLRLPGGAAMTVLVCALCGTSLDADADEQSGMAALAWVASHENGRDLRYCPSCARDNLRAIEGKLDAEFW